ncbi:polyamine aminopropyltransferase [Leptolyngbya sp. FACHB-541]|uniref:polyamine aminopropyltransferase n=1 Tax=Leptolyngbya sp. FACHB-541 TaxID=2692810 RepID=UPI0016859E34|nr:polyamine aminopropyltransferase [Leptolyngbya sp. FACHB-541]MBD1997363.1 polyamine aminopropyltransferase [Leptolyngbya sp. FACHB-541]
MQQFNPPPFTLKRHQQYILLAATAVSSSCGLAIELLLGTLTSYLVGNQALSYGVAVGGFLAAMGIGSYLSRFIVPTTANPHTEQVSLLSTFIKIELWIAPLSALLPLALFTLFVVNGPVWIGLTLVTLILGTLAGLEVPVLTRLLEQQTGVRDALSGVLALDYLGALAGSLLLPVILLPTIGLFPSAAVVGIFPAAMVVILSYNFPSLRQWKRWGIALCLGLCTFAPFTVAVSNRLENNLYRAPIISRIQTQYQRIVLTRQAKDLRLYLDGDLQFSSLDEYRYHEALVHPAISANNNREQVLLMGAGDGLALREVLKWKEVKRVVLIDLDPAIVKLAQQHPFLANANVNAFQDPRVEVKHADAFVTVPSLTDTFDVIIADFPDPDRDIIAKLYAQGFYQRLLPRLALDGIFVTQASSPFFAPKAFACIVTTLDSVGLSVHPYTVDVPSFGPWGFVLAARTPIQPETLNLQVPTKFLTPALLQHLFDLPKDIVLGNVKVNRLGDPVLVRYQTDAHWKTYY